MLVGGGVGYAVGDGSDSAPTASSTGSSSALTLPTTLTGGYQRSHQVDKNIKSSVESARSTLGAGTDMALYTKNKDQVLVEAIRLPGDALLQAGMTYAKNGDLVCATTSSTSGSEAICSRSTDALTVNVTATTANTSSKYADEVFAGLA